MRLLVPLLLLVFAGCATMPKADGRASQSGKSAESSGPAGSAMIAPAKEEAANHFESGLASYYARSLQGNKTASGERYDGAAATCAHRTHRFGTRLQVTSVESGRSVSCRVNDRGPFVKGRIVDVSRSLAEDLGMIERGVVKVRVEALR